VLEPRNLSTPKVVVIEEVVVSHLAVTGSGMFGCARRAASATPISSARVAGKPKVKVSVKISIHESFEEVPPLNDHT